MFGACAGRAFTLSTDKDVVRMSSDEVDELAALRAQRASRMGSAGMTVTALRQQLGGGSLGGRRDRDGTSQYVSGSMQGGEDDEDGPVIVDEAELAAGRMDDEIRQHLPMTFGRFQEKKDMPLPVKVHEQTRRKDFMGPPPRRPPQRAGEDQDEDRVDDEDLVGPPRPPRSADDDGDEGVVGPPRPAAGDEAQDDDDGLVGPSRPGSIDGNGAAEERDEEQEEEDPYHLPISHEVELKGFERMVSAIDVDHTGSRVAAGGHDYMVRLYDFGGMKSDARPFRELEPAEGHPVLSVSWSPNGEHLLVVTGSSKAKVYHRDGSEVGEFVRGDPYIRDMKNTKGHVAGLTCGQWHPNDRWTAMTSSDDGTVRIWDTHNIVQTTVIKTNPKKPGRVRATACCYGNGGALIAAGLEDGTLQIWDVRGKFGRSAAVGHVLPPKQQMHAQNDWSYVSGSKQYVRGAHEAGSDITGIAVSGDGRSLASRGADETLKLWDLRSFKAPQHVVSGLSNLQPNTNVVFSPDDQLVLTGTSAGRDGTGGSVVIFDRAQGNMVRRLGTSGTVVALRWSPKINQIFAATGDRKSGCPRVLYDPSFSEKGALLSVARKPRQSNPFDFQGPPVIHNPHALPMYREDMYKKRKRGEGDGSAAAKRHPDAGKHVQGPGRGGKIGTTGGTLLTQHLLKQHGMLQRPDEEEDIRETILRHGNVAEKDERFSSYMAAYQKTQPKPIFAEEENADEEEDEDK